MGDEINRDPVGGVNLYKFVDNSPTTTVDPNGKIGLPIAMLGVRAACALVIGLAERSTVGSVNARYAHCMASCKIKKACGNRTAKEAGLAKELWDLASCILRRSADHCFSAFQPTDSDDNKQGRTCPRGKSCEEQCRDLMDAADNVPGPFDGLQYWPILVTTMPLP
jgi:hypothetical protein